MKGTESECEKTEQLPLLGEGDKKITLIGEGIFI